MSHGHEHHAHVEEKIETIQQPLVVADDARGIIEKLAEGHFHSVLRMTSKKGTVRANHYHKGDSHLCYLTTRKIEYVHRDVGNTASPARILITPGQLFYTPPMVEHAMVFLEDSEFYCFTSSPRHSQKDYEEDVVRVPLVDSAAATG
jgi:dTDP-4-dehydrorhamnose 3,5-epimerase-like enzyme